MKFLEGKKTYIAAGILIVLGAMELWSGGMSSLDSTATIVVGFGLFGLGAKSERYGQILTAEIQELKELVASHPGTGLTLADVEQVAARALSADGLAQVADAIEKKG